MILPQSLFERLFVLLGSDTLTLSKTGTAPNVLKLFQNDVAVTPATVLADLVEADFDGYAPIECMANDVPQSTDPLTADSLLQQGPAAGLFRWETSGTTTALPQTIFGFYLVNDAEDQVYGMANFEPPVILTALNQTVNVDRIQFRLAAGSVS